MTTLASPDQDQAVSRSTSPTIVSLVAKSREPNPTKISFRQGEERNNTPESRTRYESGSLAKIDSFGSGENL